jgi:DNA-binding MarR family transcriptional regulator
LHVVIAETTQSVHLQAWRALLRAQAGLACSLERELMAAEGLPLAWYEVLLVLDRDPQGAVRLQRLIDAVLMTKSGVSRLVDRMETAGLVSRSGCPSDRRGAYAVITDLGRQKLGRATPIHAAGIDRHLASILDAGQAARLRDELNSIADGLGSDGACGGCADAEAEERNGDGGRDADSPTIAPRGRSDPN